MSSARFTLFTASAVCALIILDTNIVAVSLPSIARDLSLQTSAGANQTSASAQELSRLAVDLNGMVAQFKV